MSATGQDRQLLLVRVAPEVATKARRTRRRFQRCLTENLRDALRTAGYAARVHDVQYSIEVFVCSILENVDAFRIGLAHTAEMMAEMAFSDELRKDGLIERWRMEVDEGAG